MSTERVWQAYSQGDSQAREALLQAHLSLVHHVARQLSRALAAQADVDEMVSCGTLGLIDALEAYDAKRGLAFSTFAVPRIRGAILDELRRQDHVPRSVRRKTRQIAQARETLTRIFGRPAKDEEVAEHLGIDLRMLWRWESDTESAVQISLSDSPDDSNGSTGIPLDAIAREDVANVDDEITHQQEAAIVREALKGLKEQERTVLTLYFFEEMKLHEIASVLGLTESRVSQIRAKALTRLRETCGHLRMPA
jgi:RNA polymerase sigma factor for flagellar operon FliA